MSARTALRWAAAQASRRHAELLVVHTYEWRVIGARAQIGGPFEEDARADAEALVAAMVTEAKSLAPGLAVRGEAVIGSASSVLIGASETAALVVVGSRGQGGFASLMLGSVSQQLSTHARGPIAIVRGRMNIHGGPVVVGADGSEPSHEAVAIAFEEAAARHVGLVAVRVYAPATPLWSAYTVPYVEDREERRLAEHGALLEELSPWTEKYPGLPVEANLVDGNPAEVLVGLSTKAQLVVLGSRGRGGFAGVLFGSVGLQVVHHADCPVLVTPSGVTNAA